MQVGSKTADGVDAMALVHELQVHQIELEMQNEELKRAKLETEDALGEVLRTLRLCAHRAFRFRCAGTDPGG